MKSKLLKLISVYIDKYLSSRVVFAIDVVLSVLASVISILIRNMIARNTFYSEWFIIQWALYSMLASGLVIFLSKSYLVIIRHSTTKDMGKLVLAAAGKVLVLIVTGLILFDTSTGFFAVAAFDFFLTFFLFGFARLLMLYAYDAIYKRVKKNRMSTQRILVNGTTDKAAALIPRLEHSKHYQIVGFISNDEGNKSFRINDLPVVHFKDKDELKTLARRMAVDCILFPTSEDARKESSKIVKMALDDGITPLVAPSIDELKGDTFRGRLREIHIEDLLGRDEIKISMNEILNEFKDKTVMVTGAAGSIGSELCRQLATFGIRKLILFDNAETPMHNLKLEFEDRFPDLDFVPVIGDVRQVERLDFVFRKHPPQIVFHAAAYKHVPLMEDNPCEAVLVNVIGSRQVADKCIEYGAEKMVMISTDKAVNPTNIMGCTKRLAEIYVQSLGLAIASGKKEGKTKFITTRFGNVLGSNGSVIPRFRQQIEEGGPITVTDPRITRFFMTIPEACRLVMEAATISKGNQILVFDMGKPVKIDDLARKMIRLAGYEPDKDIKIEYIGLRSGEKLYEEVLSNCENTEPTTHEMIRIAHVRDYDYDQAVCNVDELKKMSMDVRIDEMVKKMKEIVPEYISNNSRYEMFDGK